MVIFFLIHIYLNDLFYLAESTNVCNFADDTTFYACDKDLNFLINRIEHNSYLAIEWFENNSMKLNQDKCHLLVSGFKYENIWANVGKTKIWEKKKQKLLDVEIDRTLRELERNYLFQRDYQISCVQIRKEF